MSNSHSYHELTPCNPQDFASQHAASSGKIMDWFTGPVLQCATCEKPFLFEWRMLKHLKTHLLPFLRRSLARRSGNRVVCTLSLDTACVPLSRLTSTDSVPLDQGRIRARQPLNAQLDMLSLVADKTLTNWPRRRAYECRLCHLQFGLRRSAQLHARQHSQTVKCNFCGLDCQSVEAKLAHERRMHADDIRKAVKTRRMSKAAKMRPEGSGAAQVSAAEASSSSAYQQVEVETGGGAFVEQQQYATVLQCQQCHFCFGSLAALTEHMTYHCQGQQQQHLHQLQLQQQAAQEHGVAMGGSNGRQLSMAAQMEMPQESVRMVSSNELQCIQGLYHLRSAAAAAGVTGEELQAQQQQQQPIYYVDSAGFDPHAFMPTTTATGAAAAAEAYETSDSGANEHSQLEQLQAISQHQHIQSVQQQQQQFYYVYHASAASAAIISPPPHPQQQQQVQEDDSLDVDE